jgi:molybdate transport system substrate-binding protein
MKTTVSRTLDGARTGVWAAVAFLLVAGGVAAGCGDSSDSAPGVPPSASTTAAAPSAGLRVTDGAEPGERAAASIKVAAAADLRSLLSAIRDELEAACNTGITFVFGSSGQLRTQIKAGADFALYLSADEAFPRELADAGLVVPNGLASYGVGRLAVAWRKGLAPIERLEDVARDDIRRLAIANPSHAPYGRAAKEALERAGVYGAVERRLVYGENVRQTTDYVEKGDADVGIVALALVINTETPYRLIDASLHTPIAQGGAVIRGTGGELTGRCVLQYLLDDEGQAALRQYGFEEPLRR